MKNLQALRESGEDQGRASAPPPPARVVGVIGRKQLGEQAALFLHHPHDPYRASFLTLSSRRWAGLGPRDDHPFTCLNRRAACTVGLTLNALRMGRALLDRAPAALLSLWDAEGRSTLYAYALLRMLEETRASVTTTRRGRA